MASREPVEAPEGTAARPMVPDSSSTSHSTVGLPRESRISRPTMSTIALIFFLWFSVGRWALGVRRVWLDARPSTLDFLSDRCVHALDQHHVEVLGRAGALGPYAH